VIAAAGPGEHELQDLSSDGSSLADTINIRTDGETEHAFAVLTHGSISRSDPWPALSGFVNPRAFRPAAFAHFVGMIVLAQA
jgi:hypothetical protein